MQPQTPSSGPTVIVDVEGGLGRGEGDAARLHATLRGLLSQGYDCILVNIAQVTYLDSVMLGAIVQAYVSAMRVGTTVKLLHASRRVKDLLAVTKLDRVLETVDSDDDRR
jgi:anti-sigma B factor antagonist